MDIAQDPLESPTSRLLAAKALSEVGVENATGFAMLAYQCIAEDQNIKGGLHDIAAQEYARLRPSME